MKHIFDFISKHKKFIKKLILFTIYVIVVCIINSEPVTNMFTKIFGADLTSALRFTSLFLVIGQGD